MTTRRQFLSTSSVTALALVLQESVTATLKDATSDIPIVDTHQHLWDLTQVQPPWLSGAPKILSQTYGLAEYAKATEGLNVVQAVYMEVDVAPEDQVKEANTLLEICRSKKGPTVAAVISGRPGQVSFAPYIRRYAKEKEIKGVRQVLHAETAERAMCLEPQFVASIKLLGELGLSFDLCMRPGELSDGLALAKQCPGTQFIVDHCGNAAPSAFLKNAPTEDKPTHDPQKWRDDIKALADQENVICKISGIIASAPKGVPFVESLAPIVNHCLDSFGPDRVIFGGDWPVCLLGGSYKDWVTTLRQIVSSRPAVDQKKLFHENARHFYGLEKLA